MSDVINVNEVTLEQWAAAESCALERIAALEVRIEYAEQSSEYWACWESAHLERIAELEARWAALREWVAAGELCSACLAAIALEMDEFE